LVRCIDQEVFISEEDKCFSCAITKGCPLLNAIEAQFVKLEEGSDVIDLCPGYVEEMDGDSWGS
jgi:hypothetical protein